MMALDNCAPLAGLFPESKFEQPRKTFSNTQRVPFTSRVVSRGADPTLATLTSNEPNGFIARSRMGNGKDGKQRKTRISPRVGLLRPVVGRGSCRNPSLAT